MRIRTLTIALCLAAVASLLGAAGKKLSLSRTLSMDAATSKLNLVGEDIHVVPGDIVAITVEHGEPRELTSYRCEWDTYHDESEYWGLKKTRVKDHHIDTRHINGKLGREIVIQATAPGAETLAITDSDPRKLLATSYGRVVIQGTVDRRLPPAQKPDASASCPENTPVPVLSYPVHIDITRIDH